MPASRSAAAMTRAPRSCPSSPGFPTSTRMRPVSIPTSSELRRRLVLAELRLEHRGDLADGAIRGYRFPDLRLDVAATGCRLREPLQSGARRLAVPLALHALHPLLRVARGLGRSLLQHQIGLAMRVPYGRELVHAHHRHLALLDRAL